MESEIICERLKEIAWKSDPSEVFRACVMFLYGFPINKPGENEKFLFDDLDTAYSCRDLSNKIELYAISD